jgi:tetratricopeptide (TPR) repeat protein
LFGLTIAAFWGVTRNDFVNYDDPDYVAANPVVQAGLTRAGVRWAFVDSFGVMSNWHPLTWLSYMLDVEWFGLEPGKHHLTSAALHALSVVVLFLALARMTGSDGRSAFVAAIFAVHPLHVQSVAWASERKDVLSALFWMLTMWCYAWYVARPSALRYASVLIAFVLGLLSKPMLVTLPFVLLLLDYWPLRRFSTTSCEPASNADSPRTDRGGLPLRGIILEKLPLLALAIVASAITFATQKKGGAISTVEERAALSTRLANAVVSYLRYVGKFAWPRDLEVFYPYRLWSAQLVLVSAIALLAVTIAALLLLRRRPYIAVGWFWFLGTLVPVIGMVQVGAQSMADRYMHIPSIGLAIALTWGVADALQALRLRWLGPVLAFAVIGACVWRTSVEVTYWRDSVTLFTRATEITPDNVLAQHNLATALAHEGRRDEAIVHEMFAAVAASPYRSDERFELAQELSRHGRTEPARRLLTLLVAEQGQFGPAAAAQARQAAPREEAIALMELASAYQDAGEFDVAVRLARQAQQRADATTDAELQKRSATLLGRIASRTAAPRR